MMAAMHLLQKKKKKKKKKKNINISETFFAKEILADSGSASHQPL